MIVTEVHHASKLVGALVSAFLSGAGDVDGEIIDTAGYEAAELIFSAIEVNLQAMPITLYESDDPGMAGATQVSAEDQLGTPILAPTILMTRVGYIGKKRYIKIVLHAGIAIATRVSGVCLLMNSLHQPTPE